MNYNVYKLDHTSDWCLFNTSLLCTHSHVLCAGRKKEQQQHVRTVCRHRSIYEDGDILGTMLFKSGWLLNEPEGDRIWEKGSKWPSERVASSSRLYSVLSQKVTKFIVAAVRPLPSAGNSWLFLFLLILIQNIWWDRFLYLCNFFPYSTNQLNSCLQYSLYIV
jgi:hypothetical protein